MFEVCIRATLHTVHTLVAGVFPLRRMMSHIHSSLTAQLILTECSHQKQPQIIQTARIDQNASG